MWVLVGGCLRSDPTENDSVEGLQPNARGPGLVTFGVRGGVSIMCLYRVTGRVQNDAVRSRRLWFAAIEAKSHPNRKMKT